MNQYATQLVKKWAKKLPIEIAMLDIMEQYNRSYEDYMNTPSYLIEIIIEKNNLDYKHSKLNG